MHAYFHTYLQYIANMHTREWLHPSIPTSIHTHTPSYPGTHVRMYLSTQVQMYIQMYRPIDIHTSLDTCPDRSLQILKKMAHSSADMYIDKGSQRKNSQHPTSASGQQAPTIVRRLWVVDVGSTGSRLVSEYTHFAEACDWSLN